MGDSAENFADGLSFALAHRRLCRFVAVDVPVRSTVLDSKCMEIQNFGESVQAG